jgi:hypothetical protein
MLVAFMALLAANTGLRVVEHVDPIDDSKSVYAIVGDAGEHLAVGCSDVSDRSSLRVSVRFKSYVGDNKPGILLGGTDVQYRFDQQAPVADRWYSHDTTISAETDRNKPASFIMAMKGAQSVFIRASNFQADPVEARFVLGDASPQIAEMFAKCGFTVDGLDPAKLKKKR